MAREEVGDAYTTVYEVRVTKSGKKGLVIRIPQDIVDTYEFRHNELARVYLKKLPQKSLPRGI